MLHSQFVPHIVATVPTGSVLAMQPLCRSHDWTVVNHYYTQNWGHTMCFLLHSQFVPHIVATVPQNWLGLGSLCAEVMVGLW